MPSGAVHVAIKVDVGTEVGAGRAPGIEELVEVVAVHDLVEVHVRHAVAFVGDSVAVVVEGDPLENLEVVCVAVAVAVHQRAERMDVGGARLDSVVVVVAGTDHQEFILDRDREPVLVAFLGIEGGGSVCAQRRPGAEVTVHKVKTISVDNLTASQLAAILAAG